MSINSPRGTQDILPPASFKWQYVEELAHDISRRYNYEEVRTPIFEYTELFSRGIGEATDIVEKEMYTFSDRSGRSITLRPEMTASVVRSFLENKLYGGVQPTKLYYIGPMFRYERPQSGRFRQFHQFGVEALGSNNPALDVEIMAMGIDFLRQIGLSSFFVELNSIGCPDCRPQYVQTLKEYFQGYEDSLCSDCQSRLEKNPLRILDCDQCQEIIDEAPSILDYLCDSCQEHFAVVKEGLDELDLNYEISPLLVRGLDYYTNTVFEVKSGDLGAQDAIFSGGRYNGLVQEIGQRDVPGAGWALGLERLLLLLDKEDKSFSKDLDVYVITIGEKADRFSLQLIRELRAAGLSVDTDYMERSVGSQFKDADRKDARYTVIIGEEELNEEVITVRDMESGEENLVPADKVIERMKENIY